MVPVSIMMHSIVLVETDSSISCTKNNHILQNKRYRKDAERFTNGNSDRNIKIRALFSTGENVTLLRTKQSQECIVGDRFMKRPTLTNHLITCAIVHTWIKSSDSCWFLVALPFLAWTKGLRNLRSL